MNSQPFLLFLPGLAIFAYAAYAFGKDLIARNWPFVEGNVISSKKRSGGLFVVKIIISYEYLVDGSRYFGDRYSFGYLAGGVVGSGEVYAKLKRELPSRPKVKVFYNPKKPSEALLVPGMAWIHLLDFAMAGVFLLMGMVVYART